MEVLVNEGILEFNGKIDFNNVVDVWKKSVALLPLLPTITIDLKNLTKSDSSCLALLVACLRMAQTQGKKIMFLNIPVFLEDLARVSGFYKLLSSKSNI